MTAATVPSTGSVPRHALRRGTRGFAAVVLFLTAMIGFAVVAFVLPDSGVDALALSWIIPLGTVFAAAHLVAIYGVIRRRAWVTSLTLYLAGVGIGVAAFGMLLVRAGLFTGDGPAIAGLLLWLVGSWIVAARFVLRGMAPAVDRPIERPATERAVAVPVIGVPGRAHSGALVLVGGSPAR